MCKRFLVFFESYLEYENIEENIETRQGQMSWQIKFYGYFFSTEFQWHSYIQLLNKIFPCMFPLFSVANTEASTESYVFRAHTNTLHFNCSYFLNRSTDITSSINTRVHKLYNTRVWAVYTTFNIVSIYVNVNHSLKRISCTLRCLYLLSHTQLSPISELPMTKYSVSKMNLLCSSLENVNFEHHSTLNEIIIANSKISLTVREMPQQFQNTWKLMLNCSGQITAKSPDLWQHIQTTLSRNRWRNEM